MAARSDLRGRAARRVAALVALSAALLLGACAAAGTAPDPSGADAADPVLATGRQVWVAHCQRCHGPTGQGGAGPKIAGRMPQAYPDPAAQVAVVRNGKGAGMPAWRALLTAEEIDAVVQYSRRVL